VVFCNILICEKLSSCLNIQQHIYGPVFDDALINVNNRQDVEHRHTQRHT